jgi:hypothetical protein
MTEGLKVRCLVGARFCGTCLVSFGVWTSWLLLVAALVFQAYVASVNEMPVPGFLLRAIEQHLADSGVSVRFGRASFDPSGRVLLQKAQFRLESFAEPVLTADEIYIRVDPWALVGRRFEPNEIRAAGANLYVPAMLSASGKAEKLVQDLDASFSIAPRGDEFRVDYLNCRIGTVCLSAHGTINAGTIAMKGAPAVSLPLAVFVSRNYVALSRELSRAEEQTEGMEHATVEAVLTPSDTRGAIVSAELFADSLRLLKPLALETGPLRATLHFPLLGGSPTMTAAVATAESLRVGDRLEASTVRARIRGILKVDTLAFSPKTLDVTLGQTTAPGIATDSVLLRVHTFDGRSLGLEAAARPFGVPVWATGTVNFGTGAADLTLGGSVAPGLEDAVAAWKHVDLRRFADLKVPVAVDASLSVAPGWKLGRVRAHIDTGAFTAYHVDFQEARGTILFDGSRIDAVRVFGRSGDNFVRGSYHQDFTNKEFRYLVTGRLRPLDITPWFGGDWWQGIFKNFAFPERPPDADFDVSGRYIKGRHFSVFGYVDSQKPVVRGVPLDSMRTLLFVDAADCFGIEVAAREGQGSALGTFHLSTDPSQGLWTSLDLDAQSTLDPVRIAGMLSKDVSSAVGVFSFESPPSLGLRGHVDGPAAPPPAHRSFKADVRSDGALSVHGVPFEKASFKVDVEDTDLIVSDIDSVFAGGALKGSAKVTGTGADKRLSFKAALSGASLGRTASAAEGYVVSGGKSTALDTFARDKSGVRLDISAEASGRPGELGTFSGTGNVQVQGSNLGEIPLFGGLSRVLRFPELRFTQAESTFKIGDSLIAFSDLKVTGANSRIKAEGKYAIDKRTLDFTATIYPFMESKSLLQIFNALSAPLSAALRVRLTGSIDKPSWSLAYSPLTLMREGDEKAQDRYIAPAPLKNPTP